jgi:hypothetical protein
MKRQKSQFTSKEREEAIKKLFGEVHRVDIVPEMRFVRHPDYPQIWAYLMIDNREQSCYALIGNDDDLNGGTLFLDLQQFEAERVAAFIQSLWAQRQEGGPPTNPSYDSYFERWEKSGFTADEKKKLAEEYLSPLRDEFVARCRRKQGREPSKAEIGRYLSLFRAAFRKAMDYRRKRAHNR